MKKNEMYFDLQMFAGELNVNVTTAAAEGNDLSAEMKTFWDKRLIDEASPFLVHDQFGQSRDIPKNGGKTIEFRKYSPLPKITDELMEGVTPDGQNLDVSTVTSTLKQLGGYVTVSDVLDLTAIDKNLAEATKLIGQQAGLSSDTLTRDILHANTNVTYCPKVADGVETEVTSRNDLDTSCMLTVAVIDEVVAKLRAKNAPTFSGDYIAIIHPYAAHDLMRDPEWQEWHKYTDAGSKFTGEIGKIGGVRFVQTSEAKIEATASGLAVYRTLVIGEGAYGVTNVEGGGLQTFVKQLGSAGTADPLNQRATVGWKNMKTAEILIPAYMVCVESCSKKFSKTPAN